MFSVKFFLFLVTLPLLAAIGTDIYLWYLHQDMPIRLSTPGYLWTHYAPDSYRLTVTNIDPAVWKYINYILAQKSILVGGVFAGFFYGLLGLLKIFGFWPFSGGSTVVYGSRTDEIIGKQSRKMQYRRK